MELFLILVLAYFGAGAAAGLGLGFAPIVTVIAALVWGFVTAAPEKVLSPGTLDHFWWALRVSAVAGLSVGLFCGLITGNLISNLFGTAVLTMLATCLGQFGAWWLAD